MGNTPIKYLLAGGIIMLGLAGIAGTASAADQSAMKKDWGKYQVGDRRSGFTYAEPETRAMQTDDFENPGMLWVEKGEDLWNQVDGKAGKSCASCHKSAAESMKGTATVYPKYDPKTKNIVNLEGRINNCRTEHMQAKAWKYDSDQLLAMTIYVKRQSFGMPMSVSVDGPAKPFFEAGKKFYHQRRGQLDLACSNCHGDHAGGMLRANMLSQGQSNGFPTYRLKWQKVGSLHRRFKGCNTQVRAEPYKSGSQEYLDLELYVAWRGRGLPVETPAVRN